MLKTNSNQKEGKQDAGTETSKEETVKKRKTKEEIPLCYSTLPEIMNELKRRNYQFIWAGSCGWGKKTEEDDTKIFLGVDDLSVGVRLVGEVVDMILGICQKCGADDAFTKFLTIIMLQLEILFGKKPLPPEK